jgi:hypothetical protein
MPILTVPGSIRFLVLALSNRAKFRARHGLEISLRLFRASRLSFHAAGDLQGRGYASLDHASVSREAATGSRSIQEEYYK